MNAQHILEMWIYLYGPLSILLVGLYGLLTQKDLLKIAVSLDVMDLGINLFIISLGYVKGGIAPIYTKDVTTYTTKFVDPLPQALVLTAIVISVAVTAFILALIVRNYEKYGTVDIIKIKGLEK